MGFFTSRMSAAMATLSTSRNPFQGGMGFFTGQTGVPRAGSHFRRNPFQGGMGFFTYERRRDPVYYRVESQSLSGWDGVFH